LNENLSYIIDFYLQIYTHLEALGNIYKLFTGPLLFVCLSVVCVCVCGCVYVCVYLCVCVCVCLYVYVWFKLSLCDIHICCICDCNDLHACDRVAFSSVCKSAEILLSYIQCQIKSPSQQFCLYCREYLHKNISFSHKTTDNYTPTRE